MNQPRHEQEVEVMEFITKFDASRDPKLWVKLVEEEALEVIEAFGNLMKELSDLCYVACGYSLTSDDEDFEPSHAMLTAEKIMDWLGDIPFEVRDEAFRRVHKSNMSKLDNDGKPIKREDGKILKGPNYAPPDMSDITTY